MSYTRLQIYNLALWNLGVKTTLQSTTGTDPKVVALNLFYDVALEQTLKDNDWNFARAYKDLALSSTGKSENPFYQYEFDYPNDCLSAREIVSLDPNTNIDFEVSSNTSMKQVINTNVPTAKLKYTRRVDKEAFFTPEFVMALGWYLAFLICDGIGFGNKKENAMKIYVSLFNRAAVANACEGFENREQDASWIEAR